MATNGGHLLVPKVLRLIRFAVDKTAKAIREKLPQAARAAEAELQPAHARVVQNPTNRVIAIKQSQSRWYSTQRAIQQSVRHFSSGARAGEHVRPSHPTSRTGNAVRQLTSRAPFASTLRPNLTGGTLGRTAGGYTHGAGRTGIRHFSHSPAAPAEVVNNVSQAVRAFWLSGKRARYDGANPRTGEKRYRSVSNLEEVTHRKMQTSNVGAPGSHIDFKVSPTITAIGPLSNIPRSNDANTCSSLNSEGVMNMLSVDFARALKDLAAIMNDLKRLSTLGDLPISLVNETTLRVRFPGCDLDTVEGLCRELGIRRGLVYQDAAFDAQNGTNMALLFPYAPSKAPSEVTYSPEKRPAKRQRREDMAWDGMMSQGKSPGYSHDSTTSLEDFDIINENPWLSSPSGYSSLHSSERDEVGGLFEAPPAAPISDYEGVEGIYRFLEECDRARR